MANRINRSFFRRDALVVAPELIGKFIVRNYGKGQMVRHLITEVEAYKGVDDLACHASKGRTQRTEIMFGAGGCAYIYLIYGIHWMLNVVTGKKGDPQAVLIRGVYDCYGPGRLTKALAIDNSFNGEDFTLSKRIWFEPSGITPRIKTGPRIGINYAGNYWANVPWRYWMEDKASKYL